MKMTKLPNDVCRCYGENCEQRLGCLRLTIMSKETDIAVRPYSLCLSDNLARECEFFIEDTDAAT